MFEIHVTVEAEDFITFRLHCDTEFQQFRVKPIVIDLQTSRQVMTSSKHEGSDHVNILSCIEGKLHDLGYKIIRKKVEYHPNSVPTEDVLYYESHIRTIINIKQLDKLRNLCIQSDWHLSRNAYKALSDGKMNMMCTLRSRETRQQFTDSVIRFSNILKNNQISFDKVEIEACVLDTKEQLDSDWLDNNVL